MADCTISITAKTASGAALANATIAFTPLDANHLRGQDGAVIFPSTVTVTCDAGGLGTITLKTGDYTYQVALPTGTVRGRITVPDMVTTTLDILLGTAEAPYQVIDWASWRAIVVDVAAPWPSVAAGLAGTAEGGYFVAASDDDIVVMRRVSGAAVAIHIDL